MKKKILEIFAIILIVASIISPVCMAVNNSLLKDKVFTSSEINEYGYENFYSSKIYDEIINAYFDKDLEIDVQKWNKLTKSEKNNIYTNLTNFLNISGKYKSSQELNQAKNDMKTSGASQTEGGSTTRTSSSGIEHGGGGGSIDYTFPSASDIISKGDAFIQNGIDNGGDDIFTETDLQQPVIRVGQFLMTVGIIVLLVVTAVMGIKYMMAQPNEQAKLKTQLIGLVVSAVVIFGAYTIWQVTVNLLESI